MAEVILMPRLSDTMTEGVIADWHKKVGDKVKKGDILAEIETDKATMELESYKDGTLLHIGTDKGGKLQVNDLLAIIGSEGEDVKDLIKKNSGQAGESKEAAPEKKETVDADKKSEASKTSPKKEEGGDNKVAASNQKPAFAEASAGKPATSNQQPSSAKASAGEASSQIDISKMEEVVLMPRLSDTMEEGVIAAWHKSVGETVKKGDVLAEIETDKATMELESYKNGKLLYIGAKKGDKIPVNALLCIIGEEGKVDVNAIVEASKQSAVGSQQLAPDSNRDGSSSKETLPKEPQPSESKKSAVKDEKRSAVSTSDNGDGRVKASPLAKRLAAEKGIDIKAIQGSGDGGRIIKSDIDSFKSAAKTAAGGGGGGLPRGLFKEPTGEEGYTDISNSQIRNIIAKRLLESKTNAPHFYLTMEIGMDNVISARAQLNEVSPVKISFNDIVVKAAALALREHPAVNASWLGDKIRRYHHIHIGIAVAIEDGLIVPVIRFADEKSLPQIATESKELSGKARNKKIQPHEFTGSTFTISNLGMMDIDEFTAIINPPESCIMAVGRIKEVVVKKSEGFGVTNVMKVTMSCDHRSVDGATGAAYLQTFRKYMENPVMMLL